MRKLKPVRVYVYRDVCVRIRIHLWDHIENITEHRVYSELLERIRDQIGGHVVSNIWSRLNEKA